HKSVMMRYAAPALAMLLACTPLLRAQQTGVIAGQVVDASTSEPRAGAGVAVVGTARGAIADANGRFVVPAVPVGNATLRARLLGYKTSEQAIIVLADDTTRVVFRLEAEATVL